MHLTDNLDTYRESSYLAPDVIT